MGLVEKIINVPGLIKIENSLFVLPFTYIGMLSAGSVSVLQFALITLALITARGSAFAANRFIGRRFDETNPKKKNWSSVKLYSKFELAIIFIAFTVVFFACADVLNTLALTLAPFVILIMVAEPYVKRYTAHRHLTMGLVIGLGILGGYIGIAGSFPTRWALYVLLLGYMCFSASNDIIYTLGHVDFDKANGLKTYPVVYGKKMANKISFFLHMWAATLFAYFGLLIGSGAMIVTSLVILFIFIAEHKRLLDGSQEAAGLAFFNYNATVSMLMLAAFVGFSIL